MFVIASADNDVGECWGNREGRTSRAVATVSAFLIVNSVLGLPVLKDVACYAGLTQLAMRPKRPAPTKVCTDPTPP